MKHVSWLAAPASGFLAVLRCPAARKQMQSVTIAGTETDVTLACAAQILTESHQLCREAARGKSDHRATSSSMKWQQCRQ